MPMDRFLIAPVQNGLQTDLKPWLIADDAWQQMNNAYVFRGRIQKRFGSILSGYGASSEITAPLHSRLRIALTGGAGVGITDGAGDAVGNVPGNIFKIGQAFSVGDEIFTVVVAGAPGQMIHTGAAATHTYNTATGAYVIRGATPNTQVYFYPAEPVMGLCNYETGIINNQPSYAFDTQFAYTYAGGFWQRAGTALWHSTNSQFFWATNWTEPQSGAKRLFVTNFNATVGAPAATDDTMYYWDGATWTNFSALTIFNTALSYVQTARIILPFKDRLILLNTIEQDAAHAANTAYPFRCRYSHNGSPFAGNAWLEPNQTAGGLFGDGAGYLDATTDEAIISAEFIKDRLIVYFEQSTWELVYTGNEILPFRWQKVNTELGSQSTFSSVPFDKFVLTVGNVGVHACNGTNVERVDSKIPDQVYEIIDDNNGVLRVWGIRDFVTEMVYWSYPSTTSNPSRIYPNKVLVYNYKNGAYAINDDCITAFGYLEQQQGATWGNTIKPWNILNAAWGSGTLSLRFRQIFAGNQQGYVFIIRPDVSRNARVMQITNSALAAPFLSLTIIDHTLNVGDWIFIENMQGVVGINGGIYQIQRYIDKDTVYITTPVGYLGTYTGAGTATRVSKIDIISKRWNPYVDKGRNVYVAKIDFAVDKTDNGEVTIDYAPSSASISMVADATASQAILGTSVLETSPYALVPLESSQTLLWHPVYLQCDGESIEIRIYLGVDQIDVESVAFSNFVLEGLVLHTAPTSSRLI